MVNTIYVGSVTSPLFTFTADELVNVSCEMACNILCDELSEDTIEIEVEYDDADGTLRGTEYATKLYYYTDGQPVAVYFFKSIKRIGIARYIIYGTSFVGVLDKEMYYGGMYYARRFKGLTQQIVCAKGFEKYIVLSKFTQKKTTASGNYQYGTLLSSDGTGAASMAYKMEVEFSVGSVGAGLGSNCPIAGFYDTNTNRSYAIVGSSPRIYLKYDNVSIDLCSLSWVYANFNITVDPQAGTVTLIRSDSETGQVYETVTETFTKSTYSGNLGFWVAGSGLYNGSLGQSNSSGAITYHHYRVYDTSGNLVINAVPLKSVEDETVVMRNSVDGYTATAVCATGNDNDMILTDYDFPDAITADELHQNLLSSISFDPTIEDRYVYGWLPVSTKRKALHQLLFASRVNLMKSNDGFLFSGLSNDVAGSIAEDSTYNYGDVEFIEAVKEVQLTQHGYRSYSSTQQVIYDNSNDDEAANNSVIEFSHAPIYGTPTVTSGSLQIVTFNCNSAVVTGKGVISGYPYLHTKKVLTGTISGDIFGSTISVSDATLVTSLNSAYVMERIIAYHSGLYKVSSNIIYNNTELGDPMEKCGNKYSFLDAFREMQSGFLQRVSLKMSMVNKAACEFLCGIVLPESKDDYSHFVVLTGNGTWSRPSGVTKIKVILIGGGAGGTGGTGGDQGDRSYYTSEYYLDDEIWKTTKKASGGQPGESGSPGKVYEVDITSPASSYSYSCGTGGAGGAGGAGGQGGLETPVKGSPGSPGASGTASTITGGSITYSSDSGVSSDDGFINPYSAEKYAYKQVGWQNGAGKGGDGGYFIASEGEYTIVPAEGAYNSITGESFSGGTNGTSITVSGGIALGGLGGGATLSRTVTPSPQNNNGYSAGINYDTGKYVGGPGGSGGHAGYGDRIYIYEPPKATVYGCGGIGGVGGGGAGSYGIVSPAIAHKSYSDLRLREGRSGAYGGVGGDGADGCIIIYY